MLKQARGNVYKNFLSRYRSHYLRLRLWSAAPCTDFILASSPCATLLPETTRLRIKNTTLSAPLHAPSNQTRSANNIYGFAKIFARTPRTLDECAVT